MKRDRRLAAAIALFAVNAVWAAWQALVIANRMSAAIMGGRDRFAETCSVEVPASGPNKSCFDGCAPELPCMAGRLGIGAFAPGLALIAHAWWRPGK